MPAGRPWVPPGGRPGIMEAMVPAASKSANPPLTIVFFGLGAVGSSMLICLAELAERDGILAWAVQGCLEWQRIGRLDPPQQVLDATEAYFEGEE